MSDKENDCVDLPSAVAKRQNFMEKFLNRTVSVPGDYFGGNTVQEKRFFGKVIKIVGFL